MKKKMFLTNCTFYVDDVDADRDDWDVDGDDIDVDRLAEY